MATLAFSNWENCYSSSLWWDPGSVEVTLNILLGWHYSSSRTHKNNSLLTITFLLLSGRWIWQFIWFVEWQCYTTVTNDFIRTIKQKSNVLPNSRTCGILLLWILCTQQGHCQIVTRSSERDVFLLTQVHTEVSLHSSLKQSVDGHSWDPDMCWTNVNKCMHVLLYQWEWEYCRGLQQRGKMSLQIFSPGRTASQVTSTTCLTLPLDVLQ